ncbi:uncharacterized protein UTRI_06221 [Ustilago trichophora]|uniref:Effector family protein Eff1 n=1 Tax=Ustilago trichophora TaxID=86804 RepID=A0A5C3EFR4_9BASI|nr:uncharacterized protein UTRI_06221 [Ustilago trichophora]
MKTLLLIAAQMIIACYASGTTTSPDTSHSADTTPRADVKLDSGSSSSTGRSLRADARPFRPQPRVVYFQPGYFVPSTPALRPASRMGPSSAGIPPYSVPLPAYTPLESRANRLTELKDSFHARLRSIVLREDWDVSHIDTSSDHSAMHMDQLRKQLERNKFRPVLPLDLPQTHPNTNPKTYAYLVEATPDMIQRLGIFRRREPRWAILEVHPGPLPRVNFLGYLQTNNLDIESMLVRLHADMGRRTLALDYVLRGLP